jgi:hypothetical protein
VRELRGLAIAAVLGLAIVLLSAGAARCQGIIQFIPNATCWYEPNGITRMELWAERIPCDMSPCAIQLDILNLVSVPVPADMSDAWQAGYCAPISLFPQNYWIYFVGYDSDGLPTPRSNLVEIRNEP